MSARSFFDSNILIYTDDSRYPDKHRIAVDLIAQARVDGTGVISTQVLQEYFAATTKKLGVPPAMARQKIELFARLDLVVIQLDTILGAIDLHSLHQLSFWDALIVRAALNARCRILYSEDMQAGQWLQGLRIVNPFKTSDSQIHSR